MKTPFINKKVYIIIIVFIMVISSCKAQIAPLYQMNPYLPEGTHFKDLDNDLNKYVGTWKWQSNDSIITMVLQKKEDVFFDDTNQYEDMIIGAYKFTVNGTEIQNYLSRLNDSTIKDFGHYLAGNFIMHKNHYPQCNDCSLNERRLFLYFQDPLYGYINSSMVLRHRVINGVEKLYIIFYSFNHFVPPTMDSPMENRIPFGDYVFVKQ